MSDHKMSDQIAAAATEGLGRRTILLGGALIAGAALTETSAHAETAGPGSGMVRRIVTGNNAQGKSVVLSDEMIKRDVAWSTTIDAPTGAGFPSDTGKLLPTLGVPGDLPKPERMRAFFISLPPAKDKFDRAAVKNWERNAAIAFIYATSGEITHVLDDGEVKVKAGDLLIQRNTTHSWYNHSDAPFTAFVTKVQVDKV